MVLTQQKWEFGMARQQQNGITFSYSAILIPHSAFDLFLSLCLEQVHGDAAGEEAVELAKKLEKEKTHVFASALRGIAADMNESSVLLSDRDTGSYTQLLQKEIVAQLRRLVKALEELPRPPSVDPPRPPDGPRRPPRPPVDPPSVLPVAELKLLRGIEADIYEKTMEVHRAIRHCGGKPNFIQKKMITRLAHRQVRLTEMTRKLRESLNR